MSESADGETAATARKENVPPRWPCLIISTEQQRARITQNFRATKHLPSRKKPRLVSLPLSMDENVGVVARPAKIQDPPVRRRIPLSEFWMARRLPSFSLENFSGASTIPQQETCVNDGLSSLDHGSQCSVDGGFVTAAANDSGCPYLGNDVSAPLDVNLDGDELDESILREIDEICEQRSAGKIERPSFVVVPPDCNMPCRNDLGGRNVASSAMEVGGDEEGGESVVRSVEEKETSCQRDNTSFPVPQAFLDYWKSLNDKQREASCCEISVPLMIMAGPGSGKTSTMVGRVLMLLKEGVRPSNILAMTFTTAAASEMRDRIAAVVGKTIAKELAISTFHSFSLQLCRLYADKLGRTTEFLIYGHTQQRRAVIEAFRLFESERNDVESSEKHLNSTVESFKVRSKKWEKFVIQAKAAGRTPDDCQKKGDQLGAAILSHYNDILRSCNALDYHDFIICSVKLLTDFPDVFKGCQQSWKAIVVDEFQDTSAMQYKLLRLLASHNCITVIGDDDQSIFSFNGANICSFDSFRKDFLTHKEVRLAINYRSTRFIVEAASHLIQNNSTRCQLKEAVAYNSCGNKLTVKECQNDASQCAFVVDKILEITSSNSITKRSFGDIAILYRRQVTGKAFQTIFRERNIPFNIHGVAFYRKKVTKAIISILQTILPCCSDSSARQSFKALLVGDKEDKKKVIEYVEKISMARKCGFLSAASEIFHAKVSGTFKRSQLLQGRKVLSTLEMLSKLVRRERSITAVVSSVANMIPHRYLLEKRAVVDVHDGKYLNEDHDLRSVFDYLLDDVSEFVSTYFRETETLDGKGSSADGKGCSEILEAFLDFISTRERENFQFRKRESENSATLTTIHQSKGLEWDTVFIVKVNESEIPLLHESNGVVNCGASLEEERRLLYVAMTRARKKLYILYVLMDSNWQFLQPSRFLKEIPDHLIEGKIGDDHIETERTLYPLDKPSDCTVLESRCKSTATEVDKYIALKSCEFVSGGSREICEAFSGNTFLKRFKVEDRSIVSHLFHKWAKKPIFQNPKRLLDKVGFVIDERLRNRTSKNKDLLRILKTSLGCDEAFQYAQHVLMWEHIPTDKRAHLMREKQEYFQKQRVENAMGSSKATDKQISYLQMLGCTVAPSSRLHASRLIEQYKAL